MSHLELASSERIEDDYSLLETARTIHAHLNMQLPVRVHSRVSRVNHNFYITPRLEIAVPSVKVLFQKDIRDPHLVRNVLTGGIAHEDGHAYLFPFMTRMNITYSIVHGYAKSRNIKWDEGLFHSVENLVSDVFNELIMYYNKIPGWQYLPETRYHYVFKDLQLTDHMNVLSELLYVHSKVFSSIYMNKAKEPVVPSPKTLAEHLYNILSEVARYMNVEQHAVHINSGGLKRELAPLVFMYDMFSTVDMVYKIIESSGRGGRVDYSELRELLLKAPLRGNRVVYWAYYTILSALYRYAVEHPEVRVQHMHLTVDTPNRPPAPPPDTLDKILSTLGDKVNILDPELADYAARQLISAILSVTRTEYETVMVSGTTKVPWYRRPRGRIDPRSLASPTLLGWKTTVKTSVPDVKKKTVEVRGVPDNITVIIDESGSTSDECTVLSPIVGVETTVFDVERVTAMAMLYNVLRFKPDVPVNLVRFSSMTKVENLSVATAYDRLKNIEAKELEMGGTEIVSAVLRALELHKDGATNYFILLTDMEIAYSDAEQIRELIFENLKLSPVLIVAANASVPEPLVELNRYSNIATVGVKTLNDYPLLEKAIYKLGKLVLA